MTTLAVRNLPDEVHRGLRVRAAEHSRSTEAEVRSSILAGAVKPPQRLLMGDALATLGREVGLNDEDCKALDSMLQVIDPWVM